MNIEILEKAISTYGDEMQVDVAIEEMSELTKALLKLRRWAKKGTYENTICPGYQDIFEEIADVKIMIEQLEMIYDCKEEVNNQIEFKLNRLKERLEQ